MNQDRVTVKEAARRLGISESGVRKRVKRGQIDHSRDEDGRVYVYLDTVVTEADTMPDSVPDRYVKRLEDEVEFLRDLVYRQQELIARQQALTAPPDPQNEPESAGSRSDRVETNETTEEQEKATERPWWRRWFR